MLTQIRKKILQKDVKKYYGYNGIGFDDWWNSDTISYIRDHSHLGNLRYSKKKISKPFEKSKLSMLVPYYYIGATIHNLIPCPSGTFTKGHKEDSFNSLEEMKIEKSFLLGETEITQGVYVAVMNKENPSRFKNWNSPVENVSWYDAVMFCNELSKSSGLDTYYKIGNAQEITDQWGYNREKHYPIETNLTSKGFRLPTEWEWEYAAKAGTQLEYSGSDDPKKIGWYYDNSKKITHLVKEKNPNAWGFYDMSGNVWEWCENTYKDNESISAKRIVRGGSWNDHASALRSTYRNIHSPRDLGSIIGFRVCRYL